MCIRDRSGCVIGQSLLLGHIVLFLGTKPAWLGNKELAPYAFFNQSSYQYGAGRAIIYHHNCDVCADRRTCRWNNIWPMDAAKPSRTYLYGRCWFGTYISGCYAAGIWWQ